MTVCVFWGINAAAVVGKLNSARLSFYCVRQYQLNQCDCVKTPLVSVGVYFCVSVCQDEQMEEKGVQTKRAIERQNNTTAIFDSCLTSVLLISLCHSLCVFCVSERRVSTEASLLLLYFFTDIIRSLENLQPCNFIN